MTIRQNHRSKRSRLVHVATEHQRPYCLPLKGMSIILQDTPDLTEDRMEVLCCSRHAGRLRFMSPPPVEEPVFMAWRGNADLLPVEITIDVTTR